MFSSGVESLLDSSVSAVIEELYTGLPESISTELMAVPGPSLGLDAQSDGPVPVLAHRDGTWTSAVGNFCQKTEDLGDVLEVIPHRPAESFPEELLQAGDLEEDEKHRKRHFRKLDCSSDGYQKDEEARGAEDCHAECCPLTLGESWSEQENPHLNQQEAKSLRTCCTEIAGSLRNTEENQTNVQVTAETLPKLTEEVQGMKAHGTRIFSKAGYRNDRVSKGLPPESNQCPDVDTVIARAGASETSVLDFLEPLKVMDIGAAADHPQKISDYSGSKSHTAMPLRTGGSGVSVLEIREEKLPRRNPLNEFSTSFANCQTCQQDEENKAYDFFKGPVPKQNEPHGFSVERCRSLSTQSSGVLCPVLKSTCYLDFGNMPLESSSAVHGIINDTTQKYLPQDIQHHTLYDHGTGFVKKQTSTSVPVEQISVVRNEGLPSAQTDPRESSATIGKLYSAESEEAAEVWRKTVGGDNIEICSWPEGQEVANSEHFHSSVFSSVASSPEEFSKEKFKIFSSEGGKLKKDQWQFCVSDPCKDDIQENCLWKETSNTASHKTRQRDIRFYSTASKIPPLSYLDLSTKQEKDSPKTQLLEKESESNATSEELSGGLVGAAEADSHDSSSTGNKTNLCYTLNITLPPVLQESRERHYNECLPCTTNEVSCRDKAWVNLSGKKSVGASGTTAEQVAEVLLHKDKFKCLLSSRTLDNPNTASRVSQMNIKSSAGNTERVVTGLENEHCHTWNCNNQSIKNQCIAASTSCTLSGSTCVDEVFLNSHSFGVEVDKIEENYNLEGESSSGYNSKEAIIFPDAHAPSACGSLLCENDWGNRRIALHGINDIPIGKNMFVCDRDKAKEQIGTRASQTDEFDKTRAVDSPNAPEDNQRNKTSKQLLVRYLNKNTCAHNFGFYNSRLGPWKRELNTCEQEEMPLLTADPSGCSTSTCDPCPALENVNVPTQHAGQTEETLCLTGNQFHPCQSEFDGPLLGSEQHLESLTNQTNSGLQTMGGPVERDETCPNPSEEILLKPGGDLPLLDHKYAREGALQENVMGLDSLIGVKNEDSSGYMGSISDLIEGKTIRLQEHENRCERNNKGTLEENFPDDKPHCSQHAHFIKCAKEKAELVFAGNKTQQSLPKMKWLVENQENTTSAQFLPISSIHKSLSYKPENRNVLSDTENRESLSINHILNNSCPQLTFEPGKEIDAQRGIGPSHFGRFDIQESSIETQVDSETVSALHSHIPLPEKEKLCMSPENTQRENSDSSSAEVFSKDTSMTKILSVTISVKKKSSNIEVPSSGNESAAGSLNGAKSSRVCAHSKESLKGEGLCTPPVKDMDVSLPKSPPSEEKFKNTCVEEKIGKEVAPRRKLPKDCPWALLEDSKESGSKIVPLRSENYGKVLEEIPRSKLNNLSKERKKDTNLANLASVLSETLHDCQAVAVSDTEAAPELQDDTTPTFSPPLSTLSDSCKEPSSNGVVCSEACVPYKLNALSKDNVKEVTEGQDKVPTHAVCKENEALDSERLDEIEQCQVLKQQKYGKMEVRQLDKAQQEQKLEHQEKAKIILQPSMLHSSELLGSSSAELMTSRNTKFGDPSEEIFAVRGSESKLYSTLQEVKRPKITTDFISSQFLKTQDSEMENLNLNLGYDGIPGAFGTTNKQRGKLRGPLPLKIQPGRTCKKVPTLYQLKTVRKIRKITSSPFSEIPLQIFPKQENTLLESLYFPCKPPTVEKETAMRFAHMPRQRAKRCSMLKSLKFRKCTKEPALLSKLSVMASKLLAPAKSSRNLEPLPCSSEILPVGDRYSQCRSKNLLEAFSCIDRNVHSRWADSRCTKMFSFQPLALYPVETTKILSSDLSHKPPTSFLDTSVFPISFHIKSDSSPVSDLRGITSQHSVRHRPVFRETPAPPSKWTLSFLLSQSCSDTTAFKEDSNVNNELHSSRSTTTPRTDAVHPDPGRNAVVGRRGGCSTLGLHTVLALSSPGCYRIWTRKRNLTSHIPTIQRLFISQFAQGLKGDRYPRCVSDDLVSSLPYSLGRVLSIWSQHGPSARPSEITPLQSHHCKWQPSVGIENSYAMLPHLPVQSMGALQTAGHVIRLETSFPPPLPKPHALPESLPSPPRLSASELQIHALDEADASVPACLRSQDDTELKKTEPEKRPKKVSQIRIRKTVPKPDPNLTPMGLPKPKRLKKKEFSLEEIYTNKNYKSPPPARSLETIFEEPKEKNGHLISVSQQKKKRILEFQDFTLPRKRKTRSKIKAVGSFTRAKRAALQSAELDVLLSQKLMDLEAFFADEVKQEQASSI